MTTGLHLSFSDGRGGLNDRESINKALAPVGLAVFPLDLASLADGLRALLAKEALGAAEKSRLMDALLFTREQLLEIIESAGRKPHVQGGGALSTRVENHGYDYPQLFVVEAGIDLGRFDRYHRNVAQDGTPVDEVAQLISGGGLKLCQWLPEDVEAIVTLDCPSPERGWIITYDGGRPHIGSVSSARIGTKCLVQVIGPPSWTMRYDGEHR